MVHVAKPRNPICDSYQNNCFERARQQKDKHNPKHYFFEVIDFLEATQVRGYVRSEASNNSQLILTRQKLSCGMLLGGSSLVLTSLFDIESLILCVSE